VASNRGYGLEVGKQLRRQRAETDYDPFSPSSLEMYMRDAETTWTGDEPTLVSLPPATQPTLVASKTPSTCRPMREAQIRDDASLWDVNDVARYLKASRSWVYHRVEAGLLPCLRVGGLLRFDPEHVRAWSRGR
jgi:excisionase family DNA binding protein